MAKRSKNKKRREPPWLQATKDRLRTKAEIRTALQASDAFVDFAEPLIRALRRPLEEADLGAALDMARLAWNLPLLHALDTEPDTDGARIRAHAERVLGRLHRWREVLAPLFAARTGELRELGRPIVEVRAVLVGGEYQLMVMAGDELVDASDLLDITDNGWPSLSRSLLALSVPARDLLDEPYSHAEAEAAIGLATVAWNLHMTGASRWPGPPGLREKTLIGAEQALSRPPAERAAFEEMAHARATRFSYDERVIAATSVEVRGEMLNVRAAGMHFG